MGMEKSPNGTSIFLTSLGLVLVLNIFNVTYGDPLEFDFKKASEAAAILETQIELTISLKNLKDSEISHKMCVTYTRHLDGKQWFEYHRTEQVSGTNSPAFAEKVFVPYLFHEKRELQFRIYSDSRKNVRDLTKHFFEGYATCNLVELMKSKKMELPLILDDGKGKDIGLIVIQAEKLINNYDRLDLYFTGRNLELFQRSSESPSPYYEIYKRVLKEEEEHTEEKKIEQTEPTKEYALVYRSETASSFSDPLWFNRPIQINSLCNGNFERELKVVCFNGAYVIGEFETSLNEIQKGKKNFVLEKETETGKSSAGVIVVQEFELFPSFTFSEYVAKGLKLRCYIAIDFSNGHPLVENHHEYNYEKAITLATTALKDYIWDQKFVMHGFGARTKDGIISDDLLLNSGAEGVGGVLETYRKNLSNIKSGSEANLAPIIEMIQKEVVGTYARGNNYSVLLAIMQGEISTELQSLLENVLPGMTYYPISIIIVGMNDSNLASVRDFYYEKVYKDEFSRDTVQFISFNQFTSNNDKNAESYFGNELLATLPRQVVNYMSKFKSKPGMS